MSKNKIKYLFNNIDALIDKEYIISLIAYNAAPTIEGLKPSSLIVLADSEKRKLYTAWKINEKYIVKHFKLNYYVLKESDRNIYILFFNKKDIRNLLKEEKNAQFLKRFGYDKNMTVKESLNLLKNRFEVVCPHEIGVFLGYLISDVVDFIDCPNKKCLMRGYWKVYNDIENAKIIFRTYDEARIRMVDSLLTMTENQNVV